jgi:hypothetical protein
MCLTTAIETAVRSTRPATAATVRTTHDDDGQLI